jgi:hypothetical protein
MYYFVYKVTNLVNGMMYIGAHSTENLDDGYLGSGVNITNAIKQFGKENFIREILQFVDTQDELFELEREIVDEKIINNHWFYNKRIGGNGGTRFYKVDSYEKIGKKTKERWENMDEEERQEFISKIKVSTELAMNTDMMKEKIKRKLKDRKEEDKERQYKNISNGLKKRYAELSEDEKIEFRKKKKESMSKSEVRKKISESLKNSEKVKGGYENPDFLKNWKPRYDSISEDVTSMCLTDMFDIDIKKAIKEKYGFGVKTNRLFKYYASVGFIDIIDRKMIKDINTLTNVCKLKTIVKLKEGDK